MKVLVVNKYYYPHIGGIENHARDIIKSVGSRVDFSVLVASEGRAAGADVVDGVPVKRIPQYFKVSSAPAANFCPWYLEMRPDIYHLHFPNPMGEIGFLLANPPGKLVVSYHSDIIRQKGMLKLFAPVIRKFLRRADRILVSSPNLIASSPFLSAPGIREKCTVIPFSIDVERFRYGRAEKIAKIRERYGIGKAAEGGSPMILFVGRYIYYKGLSYLVEAMKDVDAKLILLGSGPLEEELRAQAAAIGVAEKIFFVSGVSNDDLVDYYHACDLLVMPSIERSEAFGLVQLEAHACGKPVVSTNLPTGVPYANLHDKTGLIVEPRSSSELAGALNRLIQDEALRTRLGVEAKRRVFEEFNLEVMGDKIFEIYTEVLKA